MTFIFSKILTFIITPLVWVIVMLLCAYFAKSKPLKRNLIIAAVAVLYLLSNTFLVSTVIKSYEAKYPKLKTYKVGVLLGGFSTLNKLNNQVEFGASADRILQTVKLYKQGVIKQILVSSGSANVFIPGASEAEFAVIYLKDIGIPDSALIIENKSRNTKENLTNSLAILGDGVKQSDILVITSAWHIPRTKLIADKLNKPSLAYYPTNHFSVADLSFNDYWLPSAETLNRATMLIKEWVGYLTVKIGLT